MAQTDGRVVEEHIEVGLEFAFVDRDRRRFGDGHEHLHTALAQLDAARRLRSRA